MAGFGWGVDELTAEEAGFAAAVDAAFDAWQVVSANSAAAVAGVALETARRLIGSLESRRCWPYRPTTWRERLARTGRVGPFGPRKGEWGRRRAG